MNTPDRHDNAGLTGRPWWLLLALLPGIWALLFRPLMPLEETRCVGVAWEMWVRGDFLVPYLNGAPYSHKPPLMFWLIQSGWALFGVNDWWPRIVGPLVTLAATLLTWRLAAEIWPGERRVRDAAAWLLAGSLGWIIYGQMLMYDTLLTACVLLGLIGAWRAGSGRGAMSWVLLGCGLGLGILAKGPVALVHILVPTLLAPIWSEYARQHWLGWYGRLLLAVLGGALIAGTWAGLAALQGGEEYSQAILVHQTMGRVVQSFAHERSFWMYLVFVPLIALPWAFMPAAWRDLRAVPKDAGSRFLLTLLIGAVVVFSLISGKQPHYVLPELSAIVLLVARGFVVREEKFRLKAWATGSVVVVLLVVSAAYLPQRAGFDMGPPARLVASLQEEGTPVATIFNYRNQLAFPGRLEKPLRELRHDEVADWLRENPGGVLVTFKDKPPESTGLEIFDSFPYRRGTVDFWRLPAGGH
jgi:4-amino-4-deoxy-L-arabinose transferase-like glycosyltransferase